MQIDAIFYLNVTNWRIRFFFFSSGASLLGECCALRSRRDVFNAAESRNVYELYVGCFSPVFTGYCRHRIAHYCSVLPESQTQVSVESSCFAAMQMNVYNDSPDMQYCTACLHSKNHLAALCQQRGLNIHFFSDEVFVALLSTINIKTGTISFNEITIWYYFQ